MRYGGNLAEKQWSPHGESLTGMREMFSTTIALKHEAGMAFGAAYWIQGDRLAFTSDSELRIGSTIEMRMELLDFNDHVSGDLEVLQVEDIDLVESVQRGMNTPAFEQGRIVHDPEGSGKSEHAVHHFHGLVLDAYEKALEA